MQPGSGRDLVVFEALCEWPSGTQTEQRVHPTSNLKLIYSWSYLLWKELSQPLSTPGGYPRCTFNPVNTQPDVTCCRTRELRLTSFKSTNFSTNHPVKLKNGGGKKGNIYLKGTSDFLIPGKSSTAKGTRGNLLKFHLSALTILLHGDAAKLFRPLQSLMLRTPTPFPQCWIFNTLWTCKPMIPK